MKKKKGVEMLASLVSIQSIHPFIQHSFLHSPTRNQHTYPSFHTYPGHTFALILVNLVPSNPSVPSCPKREEKKHKQLPSRNAK